MTFNHEKLNVYQRTLTFNIKVGEWTAQWDRKHAVCDQLNRAAGSILENIAMASAAFSPLMKTRTLDYAVGSSLECAACMDLARIKRLLDMNRVCEEKEELSQMLRMLVGLRKSWTKTTKVVREACAEYGTSVGEIDKALDKVCDKDGGTSPRTLSGLATVSDKPRYEGCVGAGPVKPLFQHETLDVYRVSITLAEAVCASEAVARVSNPVFRRLDELLTSILLNIAEGNGRFSDADQARFLGTSHELAVKLAARLDLCVMQGLLPQNEVGEWKILLERISAMTFSMVGRAQA